MPNTPVVKETTDQLPGSTLCSQKTDEMSTGKEVYKEFMKGHIYITGTNTGGREADLKDRTHSLEKSKFTFQEVELRDFFLFLLVFCIF